MNLKEITLKLNKMQGEQELLNSQLEQVEANIIDLTEEKADIEEEEQ